MTFASTTRSHKAAACDRLAAQVRDGALAMGLFARTEASNISASRYVYVYASIDANESVKVRCSDHVDLYGGNDICTWAGECPSIAIAAVARAFGRAVAPGYTAADYASRSQSAQKAGEARRVARVADEREMIAAVVAALAGTTGSQVVAGRAFDRLYPSAPRAQRQRVGCAASLAFKRAA